MASQVLAFLRRSRRGTDWSQEEIAELYRIEHALLQARFSLDTDRGVSDEGDPWFVFCRADGEVLVHITRSEDGYLLYGLGLPRPLTGRVIGDISKSFVNQIPLNIPRQTDGPKLFVHPAAALAIIIGMIFLANDDVALVSGAHAAEASGSDAAEPVADRNVKAAVLAVLGKFADGTLLGGERLETNHQEGTYLNLVCTIAAVMMGASVALDAGSDDVIQTVVENADVAVAESTHAQPSSSDLIGGDIAMRVDASVVDPLAAAHAADAASSVPIQEEARLSETISSSPIVEVAQDVRQPAPAADPGAVLDHETTSRAIDEAVFGPPRPILQTEVRPATASAAPDPAPEAAKQVASSGSPAATNVRREEAGMASAADSFQVLFKAAGLTDTIQIERVLSQASVDILERIPAPLIAAPEVVFVDVKGDDKSDAEGAPTQVARGKLYPLFDNAAQEILTTFLQSNPESTAYFYDHNVIIYDGDKDFNSRPVTVQVWEFDTGATIAIVGHADNPAVQV